MACEAAVAESEIMAESGCYVELFRRNSCRVERKHDLQDEAQVEEAWFLGDSAGELSSSCKCARSRDVNS